MNTVETLSSPFKCLVMTIGELPTTFVESMSYYEALAWLVNYMEKTLLPAVNSNAAATEELQRYYIELKAYVDDYFDNLDIQTEVDNKLDEMAESGELADLIAQYLELAGVLAYDTEADLAAAENVVNGSICRTLGKLTYGDGLGDFFKIREVTNEDTVDGINLIAITNNNTLVAERIPNGYIGDLSDLNTKNKSTIVGAINELEARKYVGLGYAPFNVFVDSTNGDDDNDGLSSAHPKRTINNAIETYGNNGIRPEFRIGLKPGSYDFRIFNMTGLSLHISGYGGAGAITVNMINPNTDRFDVAFYSCHFAINGSQNYPFTFNFTNSDGMYFDGCHFSATYSTFNGKVSTIGGDSSFGNCTIPSIRVARACTSFERCNIGFIDLVSANVQAWQCSYLTYVSKSDYTKNNENSLIHAQNSNIHIFGASTVRYDSTPPVTNFCDISGSRLAIDAVLSVGGDDVLVPFTGAAILTSCVILATQARWNGFKQHATTQSVTEDSIISPGLTL